MEQAATPRNNHDAAAQTTMQLEVGTEIEPQRLQQQQRHREEEEEEAALGDASTHAPAAASSVPITTRPHSNLNNNADGAMANGVQVDRSRMRNDDARGDPSSSSAASASPTSVALTSLTADATASVPTPLGLFERWLSLWVALSMVSGTLVGIFAPAVSAALDRASVAQINIPVAALVWLMIAPMTLQVDFAALKHAAMHPRALAVTVVVNWAVQPFIMFGLAILFFRRVYASVLNKPTQDQVSTHTHGEACSVDAGAHAITIDHEGGSMKDST